ncbi:MAG TPA: hypothetical protein DCP92_01265 [Nitrospiraceae bacterium]|nr:hypothetical protein [Nitrospiraceae bacterium]
MPVMDGYELLRYLKKNCPDMPVFAMTSDLSPAVKEMLRLMGVKQSFEKPFSIKRLGLKIADELEEELGVCADEEQSICHGAHSERLSPQTLSR